jgi:hypothetical protein
MLSECGNQSLSGGTGTGSEFGDGKIVGTVYLPDGKPGVGVTVIIRNKEYIPFTENSLDQRSTFTDSHGKFVIDSIDTGEYLLEMKHADSLFSVKNISLNKVDSSIDIGRIEIRKQIEYYGTIVSNRMPLSGAEIMVLGMDRKCSSDSSGKFSILLPLATHLFRVHPIDSDSSFDFYFDETDSGDTLTIVSGLFTVIEDFDTLDDYNNLHRVNGGGRWFAGVDDRPDIYSGGSLHLIFQIPESEINGYGVIGTFLGDSNNCWFDLNGMGEITFIAKGKGAIAVRLNCRYIDTTGNYKECTLETSVDLTPGWKKYTIVPSDFEVIPDASLPAGIPVSRCFSSVRYLGFYTRKTVDLFLDEIIISGIGPEAFLNK